jgi:hypothetical protein
VIRIEFLIIKMDALMSHEIQKMDVLNLIIKIVGRFQVVEMVRKKHEKRV